MGFDVLGSGGAAGGGSVSAGTLFVNIGGNTTGTTANISSGTVVLAGGTNITLSQNANSITIVGANTGTLSQWYPGFQGQFASRGFGQSSVHIDPIWVPMYVSGTAVQVGMSVSLSTSSNSSHAGTLSWAVGIYTKNVSTLSLASSGSVSYAWSNTSDNSSASIQGAKMISVPINHNMTPGNYWVAHLTQTASANTNWFTISNLMVGNTANSGSFVGASSGTFQDALGHGHWSVVTAAMPSSMAFSDLRNNNQADVVYQGISFAGQTA